MNATDASAGAAQIRAGEATEVGQAFVAVADNTVRNLGSLPDQCRRTRSTGSERVTERLRATDG